MVSSDSYLGPWLRIPISLQNLCDLAPLDKIKMSQFMASSRIEIKLSPTERSFPSPTRTASRKLILSPHRRTSLHESPWCNPSTKTQTKKGAVEQASSTEVGARNWRYNVLHSEPIPLLSARSQIETTKFLQLMRRPQMQIISYSKSNIRRLFNPCWMSRWAT